METFLKSIKKLTQHLQSNKALDPFAFDLILLADVSSEEHSQIKKEVKNIQLIHCHEFWELTEEIYKQLMLKTTFSANIKFLKDVIKQCFFENLNDSENKPKVDLEITFSLRQWKAFKLKSYYRNPKNELQEGPQTIVQVNTRYAELQIQKLLDLFDIKDTTWRDFLYDFDYAYNFETEIETLYRKLMFFSWKASVQKAWRYHGVIKEANGGSHVYDLNTGKICKVE